MDPRKARYVAVCQHLLVLCAVGAALIPAATLVTLEAVPSGNPTPAVAPSHAATSSPATTGHAETHPVKAGSAKAGREER